MTNTPENHYWEGYVLKHTKLIIAILKEIDNGNEPRRAEDFGVTPVEYFQAAKHIKREGFVDNVSIVHENFILYNHCNVTMSGYKFLEEHSVWTKTYKTLKEIKEWLT